MNSYDYHVWRLEEVESCLEKYFKLSPGRSTEYYLELAHLFPIKYGRAMKAGRQMKATS